MKKLFENDDFILSSTGHNYDFVGIIETKTEKPLTFFFSEELVEHDHNDEDDWDSYDWESEIDEDKTKLIDVYEGLQAYDDESGDPYNDEDEEQDTAMSLGADSFMRTRDDRSTGFLSDPRERGWFLALVKEYCPDKLKEIDWAA